MSKNRILSSLKSFPFIYKALRWFRLRCLGAVLRPKKVTGIYGRIHPNDLMFSTDSPSYYRQVGYEAVGCVEEALSLTGKNLTDVNALLDFGSGFGRVTRVFAQKMPPSKISVFDVDFQGPAFCSSEFGVKLLHFNGDWNAVPFSKYDVIWAGSVFTHLSLKYSKEMLQLLTTILASDGLLVFTTHGEIALKKLMNGDYGFHFSKYSKKVESEFASKGFSFVPYSYYQDKNVGMTWITKENMVSLVDDAFNGELRLMKFKPGGWMNHQDVFMYYREF